MTNIEIIKANAGHIDDILIVENLSFKIPWSRQSLSDEILRNEFAYYICACCGDQLIGYAGMWHVCDEGHITNIAVHPEFRGNGAGSMLMEGLISAANELSIGALTLEVRRSNESAIALYKKYGFENDGLRKAYYSDNNEDAIIMWKRL
jgi:[ribosomal protein S18]-alanine N-acetyltransferase